MRASERTCERMYVRVSVRASEMWAYVRAFARSLATRARTYENKVDLSRPYFCTTLPFSTFLEWFGIVALCTYRNKVDSSRPYFRTCAHAASERANARMYAHTSVHLYAHVRSLVRSHVHSSVHSFALRSSPRPLATRTPYVHRVSWSYKSIVYEALKKAKLYFPIMFL